jgi:hypothetical protein
MTVKAEVQPRQEAGRAAASNNYGTSLANTRLDPSNPHPSKPDKPGIQSAKIMVLPQFSAKQVYFTVGVYGILLSSALWVSVNILQWVWHTLL